MCQLKICLHQFTTVGLKIKSEIGAKIEFSIPFFGRTKKLTIFDRKIEVFEKKFALHLGGEKEIPLYFDILDEIVLLKYACGKNVDLSKLVSTNVMIQDFSTMYIEPEPKECKFYLNGDYSGVYISESGILTVYDTLSSDTILIKVTYGDIYKTVSLNISFSHDEVNVPYLASTCTEKGHTAYSYCKGCNKILSGENNPIGELGHDLGEWTVVTTETCTTDGVLRSDCARCDYYETLTVSATGHSYVSVVTSPTCLDGGFTTHTCSSCNTVYVDNHINAKGHNYSSVITEPTCTAQGFTTHTCSRCSDVYTDAYVEMLDHIDDGSGICPGCGGAFEHFHSYTSMIASNEFLVSAMTCTHPAVYYYSCFCGKSGDATFEVGTPPGHNYESVVTDPTCTDQGYTTHTCSKCKDSYVDNYVSANGHGFTTQRIEDKYLKSTVTCTESAVYYYSCNVCAAKGSTTFSYGQPLGHKYIEGTNVCSICSYEAESGLYDKNWNMIASWDDLVNVYGMDVTKNYTTSNYNTNTASPYYVLTHYRALIGGVALVMGNVESIGNYAFRNCENLTSITIRNGLTSIGFAAFARCTSLVSITFPDSLTSIDQNAFYNCTSLTSITLPNSVTSIGANAFSDCTSLTSIVIPNGVTIIKIFTFENCTSLTSITIPNSVTSIGEEAFVGCTNLTSVTIGNSVTSMGRGAFHSCTSLKNITFEGTVAKWNAITFEPGWKYNVPATEVVCSDGVVKLD